jgi:hypothetical protein
VDSRLVKAEEKVFPVLRWQATLGVWERGEGEVLGEVVDSKVANLGREGDCQVHCWGE